ncbi:glycosyltransferase family 2 protein [Desulfocastanea catecholica]
MKPQVSIVVTCYNYGQFVTKCLASIQNQTFPDFEVIVVDDGSTDNSVEQIQPFLLDDRFRCITQTNGGQANAKNRGIKESTAELIAFLDADDQWASEKLERQIPLFARQETGVVYSRASHINKEGRSLPQPPLGKYLEPRRGKVTQYLIYDNFIPFSSAIVHRKCFDAFGMFDESLAMGIDWDLWLRISTKYQFDFCDAFFLLYRVGHSGQMSKNLLERVRCADRIIAKFARNFPGVLSSRIMKDADYYSCCSRGYVLRQYGFRCCLKNYWKAISLFPFKKKAYIGLLKVPVRALLGR